MLKDAIETYCKDNNLQEQQLARWLNVPQSTISRWKRTDKISPFYRRVLKEKGII